MGEGNTIEELMMSLLSVTFLLWWKRKKKEKTYEIKHSVWGLQYQLFRVHDSEVMAWWQKQLRAYIMIDHEPAFKHINEYAYTNTHTHMPYTYKYKINF